MNIVTYLVNHATDIVAIVGGFHILAVAVVKLTPTPKDDAILAKVLPVIEKFASFLSVKAKADETK
jgi:hypothetical protein